MPATPVPKFRSAPDGLSLEAISFRAGDPLPSAPLPLRIDSFSNVPFPEWRRGRNTKAEDSPVLYVKRALEAKVLSILGRFRVQRGGAFLFRAKANQGAIFGDIQEFRVDFGNSGEQFVSIPLRVNNLPIGVEKRVQTWSWSVRPASSAKWTPLQTTKHKIYVILDSPGLPWMASRHNPLDWPWTTALEYVCDWANGATTTDEAATQICRKFIEESKGSRKWFVYELKKSFNYFFEHGYFQLQQALETISGDSIAIHNINCVDAASLVTTFANLVGGRLQKTVIGRKNGRLVPTLLLPLGSSRKQQLGGNGFGFHEIAMNERRVVWDICFKLKAGAQFQPSLQLPFSEYQSRLLAPLEGGQLEIGNQGKNFMIAPAPLDSAGYFGTKEFREKALRRGAKGSQPCCLIRGLFFRGDEIPGWKMVKPKARLFSARPREEEPRIPADPFIRYFDSAWERKGSGDLMRLEAYVTPTPGYAVRLAIKRGTELGEALEATPTNLPNETAFFFTDRDKKVMTEIRAHSNVICFPRTIKAQRSAIREFQENLGELMLIPPVDAETAVETFDVSASGVEFPRLDSADYWWKFFCPAGEIHSAAGRLVFVGPPVPAHHPLVDPICIQGFAMSGRQVIRRVNLIVRNAGDAH